MPRVLSVLFAAVLACAVVPAAAVPAAAAVPGAAAAPAADTPGRTFVAVSVATVWTSPDSPRDRDRAAVAAPADPAAWMGSMSSADRRELTTASRTQTQALLGAPVTVTERRDGWAHVVVPGQPSGKDDRGYPGWVPASQLVDDPAFGALAAGAPTGTVDGVATAWLYRDPARTERLREVSVGTRLPVVGEAGDAVRVALPGGDQAWLAAGELRGGAPPSPTGEGLVATARLFLDRPYLWGGRSGFGPDCSGLTGLSYALHGITVGRDASDQARGGRPVDDPADLRPGDLLFWNSPATHVAMYAGAGTMIEAFDADTPVRGSPVRFDAEYSGARRYLP
ncbi:C40 family peptidase [Pseudonocardia sp. ICBG1293]|uniref:C40 family peptidase n=1 Tax=Pseudonocardia sp. ICBG1293 TaxID=2844382 RepID=UPI001CCF5DD2|nr:C40 family peptidase [Pseudonocardia sp. ICBG1293]